MKTKNAKVKEREAEVQSLQLQSNQSEDRNDRCWLVMPALLHVIDYGFPAYWYLDNICLIYNFKTDYTEFTQNTEAAAAKSEWDRLENLNQD